MFGIYPDTANCVNYKGPAKSWTGHVHKDQETIIAGWCKKPECVKVMMGHWNVPGGCGPACQGSWCPSMGLKDNKDYCACGKHKAQCSFHVQASKAKELSLEKGVVSAAVINDYVCPTCGNDRCSKTEKSCWKCGNSLL